MPKYFYICKSCNLKRSFYHSMAEKLKDCPDCGLKECLERVPSSFFTKKEEEDSAEVGQIVKQSIEEFKEELKEQKDNLKKEYLEKDE